MHYQNKRRLKYDGKSLVILKENGLVEKVIFQSKSSRLIGNFSPEEEVDREVRALELLADIEGVQRFVSRESGNSLTSQYIEATPLRRYKARLSKQYFDELLQIIKRCEERGVYRVDFDRSSVLVTKETKSALIDFAYAIFNDDPIAQIPFVLWLAKMYSRLRVYDLRRRYALRD